MVTLKHKCGILNLPPQLTPQKKTFACRQAGSSFPRIEFARLSRAASLTSSRLACAIERRTFAGGNRDGFFCVGRYASLYRVNIPLSHLRVNAMRKFFLGLLFMLVNINIGQCQVALPSALKGLWISKPYYDTLAASKSALRAYHAIPNGISDLRIYSYEGHSMLLWDNAFHDLGGCEMTDFHKSANGLGWEFFENATTPEQRFILISDSTLEWIARSTDERTLATDSMQFIRLPDTLYVVMNHLVIAGVYLDDSGRKYVFKDSGSAIWPNQTFKYEIQDEYPGTADTCDSFFDLSHTYSPQNLCVCYGFAWHGSILEIFREATDEEDNEEEVLFEKAPFLILRKLKHP